MPEIRVGVPALDMKAYLDDLVRLATRKEPTLFSMKAKVPTQGRADLILAATDHMSIILKAYASGGENALHAHTNEDHAFFVLQGEATFYGESNSRLATLKKLEGILVPRGALYRFEAGVAEPLVMLRVGTAELNPNPAAAFARVNDHGHDMDAYSEDNKEVELRYDREIWFPSQNDLNVRAKVTSDNAVKLPAVLILHQSPDAFLDTVRERFPALSVEACADYAGVGEALCQVQPTIILAGKYQSNRFPRELIMSARSVRWIHSVSVGVEHLVPWVESEVCVTNSRGLFDEAIAQYVVAMVLAENLRLRHLASQQASRLWEPFEWTSTEGQTLLILGSGQIGRRIALHARQLGMWTIGVRRTSERLPDFDETITLDALGDFIGRGDFIVNCLPATAQTMGQIGDNLLKRVKQGAYLINVGRGGVVDQAALQSALTSRRLAGAALDVFSTEPLSGDSPLWNLSNVTITPHISGNISDWKRRVAIHFCDELESWLAGRPLRNLVDPKRGY